MSALFVSAAILGLTFCAAPGIVMAEAIRRGIARGFWPVLVLQLGSLIGDAWWAIVALVGIAFIVDYPLIQLLLGIIGAGLLLFLAYQALMSARRGDVPETKLHTTAHARGDFATGAALSLSNPFAVAFWLGVGNATITAHAANPQLIHLIVFLGAFLLAGLFWCFVMAALVTWGRRIVTPTFFRVVNLVCGLVLIYFALTLLWSTITGLVV
jgi:threonine/homoserine/homoserine lactone efflux protein